MKYTQPAQSTDAAISSKTTSPSLLTRPRWITEFTIGDAVIERLLDDARRENDQRLTIACSKALRRVELCATGQAIARRQRARHVCAEEINARAAQWQRLREPSWYQKYAQLLDVTMTIRIESHVAWVPQLASEESCEPSHANDTLDMDPSGD